MINKCSKEEKILSQEQTRNKVNNFNSEVGSLAPHSTRRRLKTPFPGFAQVCHVHSFRGQADINDDWKSLGELDKSP